jgi:hypothetical protein
MKSLFSKKVVEDFAIVAPSGLDHLIGIVTNGYFYIHNFSSKYQLFSLSEKAKKCLDEVNINKDIQSTLQNTLLGITLSAHYFLNNYKYGIIIDE